MHFANILEPWILLRLAAGLVALVLFSRAAQTSWQILRHFDVAQYTEGQLALERQADLSSTLVRVATSSRSRSSRSSMLAGDRLSAPIRGAMCGYGVFHATPWGFRSLAATAATAIAAGVVAELYALDARVRSFDLARPLAVATLILAPLAAIDFGLASAFALNLDLSVVASCCSVQLDAVAAGVGGPGGTRRIRAGDRHRRRRLAHRGRGRRSPIAARTAPRAGPILRRASSSLIAFPLAIAASVLEVAPHAFRAPAARMPILPAPRQRPRAWLSTLRRHPAGVDFRGSGGRSARLLAKTEASRERPHRLRPRAASAAKRSPGLPPSSSARSPSRATRS